MSPILLRDLIPVLQISVGPVILVSGVGLLLLSMTNRFGRAIDRSRQLGRQLREVTDPERGRLAAQIEILYRRARVIRLSITMAATSLLLAALMIIVLFLTALRQLEVGGWIALLFIGCMVSLIISLIAFLWDIQLSLNALRLELGVSKDGS